MGGTTTAEVRRRWYEKNKAHQYALVAARKQRLIQRFKEYKESLSCAICGFAEPNALDFHHRDGTTKKMLVSRMPHHGCGWDTIMAEIEKCDVLCANCHRVLHSEVRP